MGGGVSSSVSKGYHVVLENARNHTSEFPSDFIADLEALQSLDTLDAVMKILDMAQNNAARKLLLGSRNLALVPYLVTQLDTCENNEIISYILYVLMVLALEASHCPYLASPEAGVLKKLLKFYQGKEINNEIPVKAASIGTMWNIALNGTASMATEFMNVDAVTVILRVIKEAGTSIAEWRRYAQRNAASVEWVTWSMNVLINLARHRNTHPALREAKVLQVMEPILKNPSSGLEGLKALFVVAFMVGREETGHGAHNLLSARTDTAELLMKKLNDIVHNIGDNGETQDSAYSFTLKVTLCACRDISVSDSNKKELAVPKMLSLLLIVLEAFVSNGPEYGKTTLKIGGGGNDIESAELAIETLLQLSFFYDKDEDLQSEFMTPKSGVLLMLKRVVARESLSVDGKLNANMLISRLTPKPAVTEETRSPSSEAAAAPSSLAGASTQLKSNCKHIMLSYCWANSARPELVKALCRALKALGYDIWRDEEGSILVPPMSGATDERMAEALEASEAVIICVSREYKERPNCRMEAKYANQLFKKGKIKKLVYVMMQADYTTASEPDSCDGWLGIMIGDALWYPLWDTASVDGASQQIAIIIGDHAKSATNASAVAAVAPSSPPPAAKESTVSSPAAASSSPQVTVSVGNSTPVNNNGKGGQKDLASAYLLLTTASKALDFTQLSAMLEELGVEDADGLVDLDETDFQALVQLLKKGQRSKFLSMVGLSGPS